MTTSIKAYPAPQRKIVVIRRLTRPMGGLGTLAAKDAAERYGLDEKGKPIEKK